MNALSPITVRPMAGKGRGVVACRSIASGECLEVAPTVELSEADTDAFVGMTMDNYYFAHPADPEAGLLVLGLSSLCNHSDDPNARTVARKDEGVGWLLELHAIRDIEAGDEITRRYACDLWFDASS